VTLIEECRGMGLEILPPDVNLSQVDHSAEGGAIRFGLAHIKGMPRAMAEEIVRSRDGKV